MCVLLTPPARTHSAACTGAATTAYTRHAPRLPRATHAGEREVGIVSAESRRVNELLATRIHRRLFGADGLGASSKVKAALKWLRLFKKTVVPTGELFQIPRWDGDVAATAANEWRFMQFLEFLALTPSRRLGKPVSGATGAAYVMAAHDYFCDLLGTELCPRRRRLRKILRSIRREAKSQRRARRGLRGSHLRRAYPQGPQGLVGAALNRAAAVVFAWGAVARMGEVAHESRGKLRFQPDLHVTRKDVSWHKAKGKFGRAVTVWLRPLKKKKAAAKVPVMFEEGDGGGDDVYAFLKALFRHDCHREAEAGCTPMFRERGRQAVHPKDFTAEVKQAAVRAGQDSSLFKGHSPRIGAATDLVDRGASMLMLQARGRWDSDVAAIYARMTEGGQLQLSRLMQSKHRTRDLEEVFTGFVQAA